MTWDIIVGDCRDSLRRLPERSVQTSITSPPYFGLRDYGTGEWEGGDPSCDHLAPPGGGTAATGLQRDGRSEEARQGNAERVVRDRRQQYRDVCGKCGARRVDRQIGLEPTPDEFVQALVSVFREVRRVLRDDGTVWLNLGDSYASSGPMATGRNDTDRDTPGGRGGSFRGGERRLLDVSHGCKAKDLLGIPWAVAFALRADGWYLRSDIIWAKPNPMPESVTDRPTKAHEYLFLLSKGPRYFYDAAAIRESFADERNGNPGAYVSQTAEALKSETGRGRRYLNIGKEWNADGASAGRNKRSVWTIATQPYAGAHFATFPPKLIEPCVLAGTSPKACGLCGAPWRRVVERTGVRERLAANGDAHVQGKDVLLREQGARNDDLNFSNSHNMPRVPEIRTVGWEPSCDHDDDSGSCIVLDPFAGAGTVGVVCGWHGRDFLGCELNPDYAQMARERIALEGRPGGPPAHHEPVQVIADQLGLLDGIV